MMRTVCAVVWAFNVGLAAVASIAAYSHAHLESALFAGWACVCAVIVLGILGGDSDV